MKCILHVGVHKTGSTAIQTCLNGYDDGVSRYADLGEANHSHAFATLYMQDHFRQHWKRLGVSDDEHLSLVAEIHDRVESNLQLDRRVILFSGEGISKLNQGDLGKIKKQIASYCEQIEIIMFVRNPQAMAASLFQQLVKSGLHEIPDVISVNYAERYMNLASVFGSSAIRICPYENKSAYNDDIVSYFCAIAGLDEQRIAADSRIKNTSLSAEVVKLLYLFNATNPVSDAGRILDRARFEFKRLLPRVIKRSTKINPDLYIDKLDQADFDFLNRELGCNYSLEKRSAASLSDWLADIDQEVINDLRRFLAQVGLVTSEDASHVHVINMLYYYCMSKVYASVTQETVKLTDEDADVLRDVALKYESGTSVSSSEAISLMSLAARARPNGSLIQSKLKNWKVGQ